MAGEDRQGPSFAFMLLNLQLFLLDFFRFGRGSHVSFTDGLCAPLQARVSWIAHLLQRCNHFDERLCMVSCLMESHEGPFAKAIFAKTRRAIVPWGSQELFGQPQMFLVEWPPDRPVTQVACCGLRFGQWMVDMVSACFCAALNCGKFVEEILKQDERCRQPDFQLLLALHKWDHPGHCPAARGKRILDQTVQPQVFRVPSKVLLSIYFR